MQVNRDAEGAVESGEWGGGVPLPSRQKGLRERRRELRHRESWAEPRTQTHFETFEGHQTFVVSL